MAFSPNKKALIVNMIIAAIILAVGIALIIYVHVSAPGVVLGGASSYDAAISTGNKLIQLNSIYKAGIALTVIGSLYFVPTLIIFLIYIVFKSK
jgi:hypothetical protein